jgi:signal peptidase I
VTSAIVLVASIVVATAAVAVARRRVFAVAVVGQSMAPTYRDGERILAVRTRNFGPGDVVVFTMPAAGLFALPAGSTPPITLKRVIEARPGAPVVVAGDASGSVDSSIFGPVDRDLVIGRALRPRRRPN